MLQPSPSGRWGGGDGARRGPNTAARRALVCGSVALVLTAVTWRATAVGNSYYGLVLPPFVYWGGLAVLSAAGLGNAIRGLRHPTGRGTAVFALVLSLVVLALDVVGFVGGFPQAGVPA